MTWFTVPPMPENLTEAQALRWFNIANAIHCFQGFPEQHRYVIALGVLRDKLKADPTCAPTSDEIHAQVRALVYASEEPIVDDFYQNALWSERKRWSW